MSGTLRRVFFFRRNPVRNTFNGKFQNNLFILQTKHRGADKSLARPGRKQSTGTEIFDFHMSYL